MKLDRGIACGISGSCLLVFVPIPRIYRSRFASGLEKPIILGHGGAWFVGVSEFE